MMQAFSTVECFHLSFQLALMLNYSVNRTLYITAFTFLHTAACPENGVFQCIM